jgi:hypothetical protein
MAVYVLAAIGTAYDKAYGSDPGFSFGSERVSLFKIGKADDVRRRVANLQTGCPYPLEVVNVFDGGERLEGEMHEWFGHRRVHGEWFEIGRAAAAFLCSANNTDLTNYREAWRNTRAQLSLPF